MAEILKVFTPKQLTDLMIQQIVASGCGLTDFNAGSIARSIVEAVAIVAATQGADFLDATRRAIPTALYDGLGFTKKGETAATGFLRFYRIPEFTIRYTGSGTGCLLTISPAYGLTTVCAGATPDNLDIPFATYPTVADVVAAVNLAGNYVAEVTGTDSTPGADLHGYSGVEIVGAVTFKNEAGRDVCKATAGLISLYSGIQASVDDQTFSTTVTTTIPAGDATSAAIPAVALAAGPEGNIDAEAIDTRSGKGTLVATIGGLDHVINDSVFTGGADAETDAERAERFQRYIQGLAGGTARFIESRVLEVTGIKSVTVRENYPQRGYITVVADDGSGALTTAMIDEIRKVLEGDPDDLENYPGCRPAGVIANIEPPIVIAVNVTVKLYRIGTTTDADEIKNAVKSAIERYVNTLALGDDVVVSQIYALSKNAHPAIYDVEVQAPTVNVSINDSSVARTGAGTGAVVTVTMQDLSARP